MLTLAGVLLMFAGVAWSFVNINSLPMVVDMTSLARIGTYTGLYYLFSTLSAIVGPNVNGWIIQLTSGNYNNIMLFAPIFMIIALVLMWGVRRGEAKAVDGKLGTISVWRGRVGQKEPFHEKSRALFQRFCLWSCYSYQAACPNLLIANSRMYFVLAW